MAYSTRVYPKTNPLLIDVIAEHILERCDFTTLCIARQVCQLWYKVSLKRWMKSGPPVMLGVSSESENSMVGRKQMSNFIQVVHNDFKFYEQYEYHGLRKYQNFDISTGSCIIGQENIVGRMTFQLFLRTCGEWITKLELTVTLPDLDTYQALILCKWTPNLVTFTANISMPAELGSSVAAAEYPFKSTGPILSHLTSLCFRQGFFPTSNIACILNVAGWIQLLQRSPNLKIIFLEHVMLMDRWLDSTSMCRLIEAIVELHREGSILLDIDHLEICFSEEEDRNNMIQRTLNYLLGVTRVAVARLELDTSLLPRTNSTKWIYDILELNVGTLRELGLNSNRELFPIHLPPVMPAVERLQIINFPFYRLAFLKCFPNLQSLCCIEKWGMTGHASLPIFSNITSELDGLIIPTLSKFYCCYDGDELGIWLGTDIYKLAKLMPNLNSLTMRLSNDTLRVACHCWPKLKNLHIIGNDLLGEEVNGLVTVVQERLKPTIASLQELEVFSMGFCNKPYNGNGTPPYENILLNGFVRLGILQKLKIVILMDRAIGDIVVETLKQQIPNVDIQLQPWNP